ncbi:hypothetical protein CEXT_445871 [Caerostris extrusa]|uniref:Uncharacterized protein n=1 Tax=Caerostris extrusa TaxID=172846 RepID=A0AAV4USP3_CAEEX|nr:hypothetical protein CEXT_445871 [Caerostris extrusa]
MMNNCVCELRNLSAKFAVKATRRLACFNLQNLTWGKTAIFFLVPLPHRNGSRLCLSLRPCLFGVNGENPQIDNLDPCGPLNWSFLTWPIDGAVSRSLSQPVAVVYGGSFTSGLIRRE